jgi:23S rRNA (guanosine2251-2'-O)-methyltransferase
MDLIMSNIIFGFHSIEALIQANPARLEYLIIENTRNDKRLANLIISAENHQIKIENSDNKHLDKLTSNANHQGVIAYLKPFQTNFDLKQLLSNVANKPNAVVLILDGITDPHNLGAIIRSADCFGIDAIIIPKDNSANSTNPIVAKTSSGAVNYIPIITVNNLTRSIDQLKEHQFWVAGTSLAKDSVNLFDFKHNGRLAWVLGSEGTGIRRLIAENCDYLVTIPMLGATQSLNVSVTAGVILAYTQFMQQKLS